MQLEILWFIIDIRDLFGECKDERKRRNDFLCSFLGKGHKETRKLILSVLIPVTANN